MNSFEQRIKKIEAELIDLKTASKYVSTKNSYSNVVDGVYTGLYRVVYKPTDDYIISIVGCGQISGTTYVGTAYPRTPNSNIQIVEIDTDYTDEETQQVQTGQSKMIITSNNPVESISRV